MTLPTVPQQPGERGNNETVPAVADLSIRPTGAAAEPAPSCALLAGLIPAALCEHWRRAAQAHARSLRCRDLPDIDPAIACALLAGARVFEDFRGVVGQLPACDLDECWVRRQFPPPDPRCRLCSPHSWHQDGALRHAYGDAAALAADEPALLDMLTCWIALDPCGTEAPGLELLRSGRLALIEPPQLAPDAITRRFGAAAMWRPVMAAGDALVFAGHVLHRTHTHASMTRERSSVELRFLDGERWPQRLEGDRRVWALPE